MLFVFHGTHTTKIADQTSRLVGQLLKKKPDAQVFYFEEGNVAEQDLDALIEAQGLFVEKHIVVLKQTLGNTESRDVVLPKLEAFKETQNIFVVSEGKLIAEHKRELTKHAEKIEEHNSAESKKETFNVFALGDALGGKDRKGLWTGYTQALMSGAEVESIHGTLHWAIKAMLASSTSGSADEAGEKQFTYNKFKKYAGNFNEGELKEHSRKLIEIYHDARRGKHELGIALERWILSV